jgi:hypothetical protein
VEDASGTVVIKSTEAHTVVGTMNVCPTSAGLSVAKLEQTITLDATTMAGALGRVGTHSTGNIKSSSDFRGQVDDSATLGGVAQDYVHNEQWTRTAAAEAGPEAKHEGAIDVAYTGIGAGVPAEHDFTVNLGDFSSADGTVHSSGDATQQMINSTPIGAAWDYATMDQAFVAAQRLWRNSRCVMIAVPKYGAESPLEVAVQEIESHTEEVDQASENPFEAALRHRFGQSVSAPIEARLSGKEKLTPTSIAKPPGTLTYTAPNKDGQTARVRMKAISRQGIGILVIAFTTGRQYEVATKSYWEGANLTYTASIQKAKLTPTNTPGHYSGTATVDWVVEELTPEPGCPKHRTTFTSQADLAGQLGTDGQLTVDITYKVAVDEWRTHRDCTFPTSWQILSFTPATISYIVPPSGGRSLKSQKLIDTYTSALNFSGSVEIEVTPSAEQ